jgi:hydrophobe/amphiphile efflux-3 (HAE3) family protein
MEWIWRRIGRAIVGHGRAVGAVVVVVTLVLGVGLTRLRFETSQASLISPDSEVFKVSERYQGRFGGEPMIVLFSGPVDELVAPADIAELGRLEDELRATGDFTAVLGPVTALEFAMGQLDIAPGMLAGAMARDQAAAPDEAAKAAVADRYGAILGSEAARLGAAGARSLDNPAFVQFLLREADGTIRPALRDNFPDDRHGVLIVRLPGNTSIADQGVLSDQVRAIVDRHPISGFDVVATGPPVLLKEINDYLQSGMATLGALAAVVMLVLLWLVFRARWRLLSLGVVVLGLVWSFGALGYLGVPLSMVTISGLPILLGLGVDFAVQTHNRFEEELRSGHSGVAAVDPVMTHMAVPLTIAMFAAVAGFLALQLSEVPMIKDFGILLGVGMVVLVFEAILVMTALLLWRERRNPVRARESAHGVIDRVTRAATRLAPRWAIVIAAIGLVIGAAGIVVEGTTPIQTDPEAWVGSGAASVKELVKLREGTGFSSEIGLSITAADTTSSEVVGWIDTYARRLMELHPKALVRPDSPATLVSSVTGATPSGEDVQALLSVAPKDYLTSFVSPDKTQTNLIFPMAPLSLQARERLLDQMVADLDPPAGVTATPSGLAVIGIELVNALEANRQVLTLAALGLVAIWLLAVYRKPVLTVLALVPVVVAVGASGLAIDLLDMELTPLTTVSGPLAIAITTEFSVLLVARFLEERAAGRRAEAAVDRAASRIGRAFLASGLTLLGGFVVLAFSPMPLLIDFGVVVALDVALALVSVLVVLPPLLRWAARWLPGASAQEHLEDLIDLTGPITTPLERGKGVTSR